MHPPLASMYKAHDNSDAAASSDASPNEPQSVLALGHLPIFRSDTMDGIVALFISIQKLQWMGQIAVLGGRLINGILWFHNIICQLRQHARCSHEIKADNANQQSEAGTTETDIWTTVGASHLQAMYGYLICNYRPSSDLITDSRGHQLSKSVQVTLIMVLLYLKNRHKVSG
jgi:hypothetical protein